MGYRLSFREGGRADLHGRLGKARRTSEKPGLEVQGPETAWVEGGDSK